MSNPAPSGKKWTTTEIWSLVILSIFALATGVYTGFLNELTTWVDRTLRVGENHTELFLGAMIIGLIIWVVRIEKSKKGGSKDAAHSKDEPKKDDAAAGHA